MEVAWRGRAELSRRSTEPVFDVVKKKKRAWGVDAHKVVQLMMGQQLQSPAPENTAPATDVGDEVTLDLLGGGDQVAGPSRTPATDTNSGTSRDFLQLAPDQPRLSSDWKMCLDLKSGKMSGVTLENDPRIRAAMATAQEAPQSSSSPRRAHEFLRSKESEILRAQESSKSSSSSSSGVGSPPRKAAKRDKFTQQMLSFSTGSQLWNLQLDDMTNYISLVKDTELAEDIKLERSNLELDLNLTASGVGSPASCQQQEQSVCTMEMVQRALRETDQRHETSRNSRELPIAELNPPKLSGSPSFSSLTSALSEPAAWSLGSPSTSGSSAISSRSPAWLDGNQGSISLDDCQTPGKALCTVVLRDVAGDREGAAESCKKPANNQGAATDQLVMGACTRCLMYVMLAKSNQKCPRCGSEALLNFAPPAAAAPTISCTVKRQRVEA